MRSSKHETLPPHALTVLRKIRSKGRVKWKDLLRDTRLPGDLLTSALKFLEEGGLIVKEVDSRGRVTYCIKN